jgi:NAD(P)-dependent dehydrogenase (short-subunit alcohol dehydrogenase family)
VIDGRKDMTRLVERKSIIVTGGGGAGYRDEPNAVDDLAKTRAILCRVSTPRDLVGATTFLASEKSNYIAGQNLVVDGGVGMV